MTSKDIQTDERTQSLHNLIQEYGFHSLAVVPFRLAGRTIGVLCLLSPETGFFKSKEEILLLEEMGLDISFALDTIETERIKRQWADAFEHCAHGIVIGDPYTNRIRTCNPAFARELGGTIDEFISMPLVEMYAPDDREQIKQYIGHSDRTGSVRFEANKIRKDGSVYAVQMDLVSVRDEHGNLLYRVATQQDISERKQAEQALLESWERYKSLFESNPHPMWVYDLETLAFLMVNDAAVNHYGYSREEFLGMSLKDIRKAEDIPSLLANLEQEHANLQHTTGWRHRKKDGSIIDVEISSHALQFEGRAARLVIANDITERLRTEQALNEIKSILSMAEEVAQIGSWKWDLRTQKVTWSDEMFRLFGVERQGFDGDVNRVISERIHPDDMAAVQESNRSVLEDTHPIPLSYRILLPDGTERSFWAQGKLIRDEAGQPVALTGYVQDTTERKRAEEKLLSSQRTLKLFVEHAPAAIAMLDRNMVYIAASHRYLNDYRLPAENVVGRSHYEVFPEIPERWKEIHRRCLAGEIEKKEEDPFLRADGSLDWIRWEIHPWHEKSGEVGGIILFSEVITKRRQAEEKLRESEERFRSLYENATVGIYRTTPDGRILLANPTLVNMLGYSSFEELAQRSLEQDGYAPRYERSTFRQQIEKDKKVIGLEAAWVRRDGSTIFVRESARAILDESGKPVYYEGTVEDITERKQAEEALQLSEERHRQISNLISDYVYSGIVFPDGAARTEWVSGAIEQMTGYTVEEINQLPAGFSTLILPEDLKRTFGEMSGSLEKESSKIEYRIRRRDGQIRWFRDFMDYQPGEGSGAAVRMIGAVQDITEQVRVEREIRERTEDLLIINALNEAINRGENFQSIVEVFARETRDVFACNDVSVYLLNQDGKYIEMQNSTLSPRITEKIEKLIGRPIPKIQLPVRPGSYFAITMENDQGYITSDPKVIQEWIEEFTETTFLPTVMRPVMRKIVPQIYKALNIKSVMSVPLISSGQTIGILDMSSKGLFTNEDLHRIRSISHQMTAAIMRKQAEEQVQLQLRRMGALSDIDRAISSSLDMRVSLEVVLTEVLSQLKVDACVILLFNEISFMLEYYAGKGFRTLGIRQSRVRLGEGIAGRVGLERILVHLSNPDRPDPQFTRKGLVKDEGFVEYFAVPLVAKGMLKGVLEIFHRTPLHPDLDWISYLETLGGQTAIAIDNAQLFEGMQKSNLELIAAYDATIAGWSHAMDLRDKETEGHSQRVTDLTLKLAERLRVSDQERVHIRRGALLHDIGKLGVPDQILLKQGQLTADDWSLMRQHPMYAFEMLSPINYLRPALDIPYCHHENWDGTGYPRGLKGEQIPMAARIFAVVDVWDALRSNRPYRKAWDEEKALNYIRAEAGKHFDPHIVQVFLDFIRST